jgi:hypothetical protein
MPDLRINGIKPHEFPELVGGLPVSNRLGTVAKVNAHFGVHFFFHWLGGLFF